jgi:Asp-tRNA(Asn)/Glu-tRNA(Gln) amidotransferase A subunit family amidase
MFAFVKTPHWERTEPDTREAFTELVEHLGARVEEVELFASASEGWQWHRTIMAAEMALNLEPEWTRGRARLSEPMQAQLATAREVRALDYLRALARVRPMVDSFRELFEQRYDAILTPAALGTAPSGLTSTGDPIFNALWTLCGMPAVSVPLMQGGNGLPLGIQLVGPRHGDARLLRTARWLVAAVRAD